jgi:hypothetical protein
MAKYCKKKTKLNRYLYHNLRKKNITIHISFLTDNYMYYKRVAILGIETLFNPIKKLNLR